MATAIDSRDPLVYTPVMPLQPTWTSVMSQDIVTTAAIPVDATSATPVAPFTNTTSGRPEALVIANLAGNGDSRPRLCHIARNPRTDGGWSLQPLFGGRVANEVASGSPYAITSDAACFGFFNDDSGLHCTQLGADGATWSNPQTIRQGAIANLKVAYSPAGRVVLYGNSSTGDLITAYQVSVGGPFVTSVCAMQGALLQGDFHLCLTDEASWTLATNVNGRPSVYTGIVGASEYSSAAKVTQFQGTLAQVVLGYWSNAQNTIMFMLVDADNALHVWSMNAATSTPVIQPVRNSEVTKATGHVSTDRTLHVYSVDKSRKLWVLHQDKDNPWNDDGTPHWSPYIPLDTEVATVVSDTNPADAPSLFACAAADYSLRLHARDRKTGMWRSGPVLQDAEDAFEIVRFRTEITVLDANGVALSGYPVSIAAADGCSGTDITVGGTSFPVDSDTPVTLKTDHAGKLTLATLTNAGMVTPGLTLQANGMSAPLTIQPAAPVHNYLAGKAPLNPTNPNGPLPTFDQAGNALIAAKVNGQPLAPGAQGKDNAPLAAVAASAIQQTALVGIGKPAAGVAGFSFSVSGPQGPWFEIHRTKAEIDARRAQLFTVSAGELGSVWNQIEQWSGDVWEGIKNGLIEISNALVDIAGQVVSFTATIGEVIAGGVKLALKGLEQAAHFISGVFASVEAALANVIDWLKAMFDFGAIWRTKKVFEDGLLAIPEYLKQLIAAGQSGADKWFSKKESDVTDAFDKMKKALAGKRFGDLQNFPTPGQPPSQQVNVGGGTPAGITSNVHHNWLQDKVSSSAPPDFGTSTNDDLADLWTSTAPKIVAAGQDFLAVLTDFKNGITSTIENPSSFVTVSIPDFLDAIAHLIDAMLRLCDVVLDLFLGLARLAMDAVETMLSTPVQLGPLNTLWSWMAAQAGDPSDNELTMGAVLALMAAFPATVAYKLVAGADAEPFPDGQSPWRSVARGARAGAGGAMPTECRETAAILQMLYAAPAMASDALGPASPGLLGVAMLGLSGLIWILNNGLPDLGLVEAGLTAGAITVAFVTACATIWGSIPKFLNAIKSLAGANALNDGFILLFTLYGVGKLALLVLTLVSDPRQIADGAELAAGLMLPLPYIMGMFNLTTFRSDPFAPLFMAVVLIFDAVGFVGGGAAELIDAFTSPLPAAAV